MDVSSTSSPSYKAFADQVSPPQSERTQETRQAEQQETERQRAASTQATQNTQATNTTAPSVNLNGQVVGQVVDTKA